MRKFLDHEGLSEEIEQGSNHSSAQLTATTAKTVEVSAAAEHLLVQTRQMERKSLMKHICRTLICSVLCTFIQIYAAVFDLFRFKQDVVKFGAFCSDLN